MINLSELCLKKNQVKKFIFNKVLLINNYSKIELMKINNFYHIKVIIFKF